MKKEREKEKEHLYYNIEVNEFPFIPLTKTTKDKLVLLVKLKSFSLTKQRKGKKEGLELALSFFLSHDHQFITKALHTNSYIHKNKYSKGWHHSIPVKEKQKDKE